jgi:hypothetical protein
MKFLDLGSLLKIWNLKEANLAEESERKKE